ncbi:putative oxidoreductase [Novosphingobium endophyticum]|uniref:Oxidoreductase n=1 Tax=Novosphingobium endophyticum TaxID=1955250 RepID=A0A916TXQ8_9SPHN|nr:SDR family oxidoreductase [Novosphingobium endophyticum]GGC13038.1 putative oxidoreductase [Novosphingobium endophyticum]
MRELSGKTVFITGGDGGIGGGIARAFAERGARIVLADIDLAFAREEAARLPADTPVEVAALDVRSLESWASACDAARARFGAIDVLCNNAGISSGFKPLIEIGPDEFERLMAINVTGVYNGIHTVAPEMIARGSGHIVNTSSMNGLVPFGSFAAYSASKFAVLGLSDALREELAPHGVGVSTLFPGLTRSRMAESDVGGPAGGDPERVAALRARMMDPLWLGRAVVRAVEADESYIVTHPEYRPGLEARHQRILAAFGEPAQPNYSTGAAAPRVEGVRF